MLRFALLMLTKCIIAAVLYLFKNAVVRGEFLVYSITAAVSGIWDHNVGDRLTAWPKLQSARRWLFLQVRTLAKTEESSWLGSCPVGSFERAPAARPRLVFWKLLLLHQGLCRLPSHPLWCMIAVI